MELGVNYIGLMYMALFLFGYVVGMAVGYTWGIKKFSDKLVEAIKEAKKKIED